ncbi:MAG: DEAD/DEAH box helicase [Gammaproteobacteria bacterium]|nr:DEAD/DEAH box helicase [Gammaproteobacteria bacterium]
MQFRIADTFTDSLSRLTGGEQKVVKMTSFDLQLNPANPGMSFHKLDRAKDKNFWSIRVNRDIRIIVHKTDSSLLLCYVDHHDKAYHWAERRRLDVHPKTGAAQLVEVRETIQEILVPTYVPTELAEPAKPLLFEGVAEEVLLGYGVPKDWVEDVLGADEDSLLQIADHLPGEAAEALLELATGGQPQVSVANSKEADPFDHPDAQRRFRLMTDSDELAKALDYPWDKWTVFLHPTQRNIVEKDFNGPARVSGSAGTGKTIVALHRAVRLARSYPDARVLLTTFSNTLANALRAKLRILISDEPRLGERLEVHAVDAIGEQLYEAVTGAVNIAPREKVSELLSEAAKQIEDHKFTNRFLLGEWEDVVDAWQLEQWEDYRDVVRLGRKTRLPEKQRAVLWSIFELVKEGLKAEGVLTRSSMFSVLATKTRERKYPPFDFAIVDEAQDVSVAQLRFLSALGGGRSNALFFAGDLGQRIFQTPFSWKALGVDIRGRSQILKINYRTSHQIRMQADRLLGPEVSDVDGNVDDRHGTVSVFNGPDPDVRVFSSEEDEISAVSGWIEERISDGLLPHEIGLFVRSDAQFQRAEAAVEPLEVPFKILDEHMETITGRLSISSMHLAKGLEFRAVVVMACDDEILPLQERMESVSDDADLEEVYDTERHLLYVACTRARDHLLVSSVDPESEFLDDLKG